MIDKQREPADHGVTVAIPVYNEERLLVANVRRLVEYLDGLAVPYELLIGSNGSTDATVELGQQLARDMAQVRFFHLRERGVGLAFQQFIARAAFPVLVSLDMDLSSDVRFVERALPLVGRHVIVVGSKRLASQKRSAFRRCGSDLFLWCVRRATGLPYDDYSIGAKAYCVEFLRAHQTVLGRGSSYVLDLCFEASRAGQGVCRIPIDCEDRRASKFNLWHEAAYKFTRLGALCLREGAPRRSRASTRIASNLATRPMRPPHRT